MGWLEGWASVDRLSGFASEAWGGEEEQGERYR